MVFQPPEVWGGLWMEDVAWADAEFLVDGMPGILVLNLNKLLVGSFTSFYTVHALKTS